jgi:hypothetical protein
LGYPRVHRKRNYQSITAKLGNPAFTPFHDQNPAFIAKVQQPKFKDFP